MDTIENFKNYDVDIADIWFCERNYFFSKEHDLTFASKLLNKIQPIISIYGKPSYGIEMCESGDSYYGRQYAAYVRSLDSFEKQFALDFFFAQDKCFEYNNPIIIPRTNNDFSFWFALKLRQYDGRILEIDNFLNSHLKKSFRKNRTDFIRHLKLCIRQYPDLVSAKVIDTVNEFMEHLETQPDPIKVKKQAKKKEEPPVEIVIENKSETTPTIETTDIETPIKDKSNKKEKKSPPLDSIEDIILGVGNVNKFLQMEETFLNPKDPYLTKSEDDELHWKKHKRDLIALILLLREYKYFSLILFDTRRNDFKLFFEKRYNLNIGQQFEEKKAKNIKLDDYKLTFYSFIDRADTN